ncbi:hypothetical protein ACU635_57290 [[Actinomadura] parvosata]|uniref:hypothetical protein n=1 Tax=[Actinomadura] parvosata TaxID=1955412 RepID=UPI00406C5A80
MTDTRRTTAIRPDASRSGASCSDAIRSDASRSDAIRSDAIRPDANRSDVIRCLVAQAVGRRRRGAFDDLAAALLNAVHDREPAGPILDALAAEPAVWP